MEPKLATDYRSLVEKLPNTLEVNLLVEDSMWNAQDLGLNEEADDDGEAFWACVYGMVLAEMDAKDKG
jgi:hypothetical protein